MPPPRATPPCLLRILRTETRRNWFGAPRIRLSDDIAPGERLFSLPEGEFSARPRKATRRSAAKEVCRGRSVFAYPAAGIPAKWVTMAGSVPGECRLRFSGRLNVSDESLFSKAFSAIAAQNGVLRPDFVEKAFSQSVETWIRAFLPNLDRDREGGGMTNPGFDPDLWTKRMADGAEELPFSRRGLAFETFRVENVLSGDAAFDLPVGRQLLALCSDKASDGGGETRIMKAFSKCGHAAGHTPLRVPAVASGESLGFELVSRNGGFVTVICIDETGAVVPLLPHSAIPAPMVCAGEPVPVGKKGSPWICDLRELGKPGGRDSIAVIVSREPVFPSPPSLVDGAMTATDAEALLDKLRSLPLEDWNSDTLEFDIV